MGNKPDIFGRGYCAEYAVGQGLWRGLLQLSNVFSYTDCLSG